MHPSRPHPSRVARLAHTLANTLIGLVAMIFFAHAVSSWYDMRAQTMGQLDAMASLMKRSLETYLLSKEDGLRSLIDNLEGAGGLRDLAKVQKILSDYKSHREDLSIVFVHSMEGQVLATTVTNQLTGLPFIGDVPSYKRFLAEHANGTGLYIGQPQIGKAHGTWNVSLRLILRDASGTPVAVVSDVIQTATLAAFWSDALAGGLTSIGILRDDNYLLGRFPLPPTANLDDVYGKPRNGALAQHLTAAAHPQQGVVEGPNAIAGGEKYLNYYRRLDKFPLTVFATQPLAQIRGQWLYSLVMPFAVMLLFVVGAKMAVRRITALDVQLQQQRMASEADLQRSADEQRFLVDHLMTGLVIHDHSGRIIRCNQRATELLGLSIEQMTNRALMDPNWHFLREDGSAMPVQQYPASRVLSTQAPVVDYLVGVVKPDTATPTWLLSRADPWFDDERQLTKIVVTFVDVTARRELEVSVRDKDERFKALFENSMDAVMMTTPDGRILEVNRAGCTLFGLSEAQIVAGGRSGVVDMTDPRLQDLLAQRAAQGSATGLLTMKRGDGSAFTAVISTSIYTSGSGTPYSSMVVRDITELLQNQQRLQEAYMEMRIANDTLDEMAHFDPLTHLPNRVLLAERLEQAILQATRRNKSVGVAFMDIDGFAAINDTHGHAVGDQLLVSLAHRLKDTLREGDTLSRLGGDEFVVVLGDLGDPRDLEPFLNRLLAAAADPMVVDGIGVQVSASIGVTTFPQDGASPEQLLRHADQAMYSAKQSGKNRFHLFDVASDAAVRSHREQLDRVVEGMRQAQFVLFYQPQVNLVNGELLGVEGLVRWMHPTRGVLGPGEFLPVIENDPLALAFGDMVLEAALQQLQRWQQAGYRFKLSVNLFNQQIQDPGFPDRLQSMMAHYPDLRANSFKLEIVETNALTDVAMVSAHMCKCIAMGVEFAVDDFGTGYSSLTYLKKLPAQQLKIDQTFVRGMLSDREDLAIVQGVIGLADAFEREVVAEGVETVEQAKALIQLGCVAGQGFGIGKPMPESVLGEWLRAWTARQPWVRL